MSVKNKQESSMPLIKSFHYSISSLNRTQKNSQRRRQEKKKENTDFEHKYLEKVRSILNDHKKNSALIKKLNLNGRVGIKLKVDSNGLIQEIALFSESVHDVLNKSALDSVKSIDAFPRPPIGFTEGFSLDFFFVFE